MTPSPHVNDVSPAVALNNSPTNAAPPSAGTPAVQSPADDVAALRREVEDLRTRAEERERAAQFWYERANGGGEAPPAGRQPAASAPDPEPDPDVLDVITTQGTKGLTKLFEKAGFVRSDQVNARIEARAQSIATEQRLRRDYPELSDQDSEFFKLAARNFAGLKNSGVPEALAMELAAERTALALTRSGKMKTPSQEQEERESERRRRAAAAAGDGNARPAQGSEDDETIGPDEQRAIGLLSSSLDIPYEEAEKRYKARAKKGVQVSVRTGGSR